MVGSFSCTRREAKQGKNLRNLMSLKSLMSLPYLAPSLAARVARRTEPVEVADDGRKYREIQPTSRKIDRVPICKSL